MPYTIRIDIPDESLRSKVVSQIENYFGLPFLQNVSFVEEKPLPIGEDKHLDIKVKISPLTDFAMNLVYNKVHAFVTDPNFSSIEFDD